MANNYVNKSEIPARSTTKKYQRWVPDYSAKIQEYDDGYFDSIECCLAKYEHLQEVAPILELALWRANINVQSNSRFSNIERNRCRVNIFFMVAIIIPFL